MGSLKDPKTWIPYINPTNKDCSKKICTVSCTQWCKYIILPSPPPPPPQFKDDLGGGATLSPVAVVIITLIGSFLLLICYYLIMWRYCSRNNESSVVLTRQIIVDQETRDQADDDSSVYVPWLVLGKGLDEAFVKSIAVYKYKKEDGLVTCTDCSVCLGEFQEDESIKLLPKCSHAFHVYCIDTWLKTHLNCPLCRANVCCNVKPSPQVSPPPPVMTPTELEERDVTIEIREEGRMRVERSKSMDNLCQNRASKAQVLVFNRAQETARQEVGSRGDVGSSENVLEGNSKGLNLSHFGVKRSYSSGRYL